MVSAEAYKEERLLVGSFRCDRCTALWPLTHLREQDGLRVCKLSCFDTPGIAEAEQMHAEAARYAASRVLTPHKYAARPAFEGAVSIRDISSSVTIPDVLPLHLTRSGASGTLTLLGNNLSTADTITYPTGVTASSTVYDADGQTLTLTLSAGGTAVPGDQSLTYNGASFTGIFRIS